MPNKNAKHNTQAEHDNAQTHTPQQKKIVDLEAGIKKDKLYLKLSLLILAISFIIMIILFEGPVIPFLNDENVSIFTKFLSSTPFATFIASIISAVAFYLRLEDKQINLNYAKNPIQEKVARDDNWGMNTIPSAPKKVVGEKPSHTFKDIEGMTDLKDRLLRAGQEIVKPSNQDRPRNGILLYGPPGTGKTFIAEGLAGELGLRILKVNFGELASKWVNQTTEQVMAILTEAQYNAPIVLFMDEIDAILVDRSKVSRADSEEARLVSSLLPKIEALRRAGVLVMGATNLLESLDKAAIREGRFDFKIEVPNPDEEARFAIALARLDYHHGKGFPISTTKAIMGSAAKRWRGFSIARIHAVIDETVDLMKRSKIDYEINEKQNYVITAEHLQMGLRSVQGRNINPSETAVSIDDLITSAALKEQLSNIVYRMKNIEEIEALGASVPNGILFAGPPGTGKTFTAKALANSADWAFIDTTGHELLQDSKKIDTILKQAGEMRPCMVFIDEADDVFTNREHANAYASSVTNKLLASMDGSDKRMPDIIFIAATNHPDRFDPAALRAGRFTEKIMFALPQVDEIIQWLEKWRATKNESIFGADLDNEVIAQKLLGLSIANIQGVMQQAINAIVTREVKVMTLDDVRKARQTVVGGV